MHSLTSRLLKPARRWLLIIAVLGLAAPVHADTRTVYVGDAPLNLRAGPGLGYAALAELPPGEPLTVVGESGLWLNVQRANGQSGWVHGDFVISSPPASVPAAPPAVKAVEVDTGRLNLRAEPNLSSAVVAELPQGERLNVLAQSGVWLNLRRANGQTGWVNSLYVTEATGPVVVAPIPTAAATPAPSAPTQAPAGLAPTSSAPAAYAVVIPAYLNLREGPGLTYPAVAELLKGETLTVLSRLGGWLSLQRSNGHQGWANSFYLKLTDVAPTPAPLPPVASGAGTASVGSGALGGTALGGSALCRPDDVLFGVQNPERLRVINSCLTVTGTVVETSRSDAGDLTFRLRVDPAYAYVLNSANRQSLRGYLQVEIIPADQLAVPTPAIGSRVSVTGAYVQDVPYGWNEIHPAWLVLAAP